MSDSQRDPIHIIPQPILMLKQTPSIMTGTIISMLPQGRICSDNSEYVKTVLGIQSTVIWDVSLCFFKNDMFTAILGVTKWDELYISFTYLECTLIEIVHTNTVVVEVFYWHIRVWVSRLTSHYLLAMSLDFGFLLKYWK